MAPQKADNENLNFLYTCFKSAISNGGKVDIAAVAALHQINVPAASMRLTRLRKALDARTGQDADGKGNNDAADMTPKAQMAAKPNGKKSTPATARKIKNGELTASSPAPVTKGKKRKLAEIEQAEVEPADAEPADAKPFEDELVKFKAEMDME